MQRLWEMKPIQTGLQTFAAGTVCVGAYWLYKRASEYISGPSDAGLQLLLALNLKDQDKLKDLYAQDPEMIDLLARLEPFRSFHKDSFDEVIVAMHAAVQMKLHVYQSTSITATKSFKIRAEYQKIIEALRLFRAILEIKIATALEDFDEVAVDINAKVEQSCSDTISDSYMN